MSLTRLMYSWWLSFGLCDVSWLNRVNLIGLKSHMKNRLLSLGISWCSIVMGPEGDASRVPGWRPLTKPLLPPLPTPRPSAPGPRPLTPPLALWPPAALLRPPFPPLASMGPEKLSYFSLFFFFFARSAVACPFHLTNKTALYCYRKKANASKKLWNSFFLCLNSFR